MTSPSTFGLWVLGFAIAAAGLAAIDVTAVAVLLIGRLAHLWPNRRVNDRGEPPRRDA